MNNINDILDSVFNEMMDSLKNDPKYLEMLVGDTPISGICHELHDEHFDENGRLYINPDISIGRFHCRFSRSNLNGKITNRRTYLRKKARGKRQIEQLPSNFVVAIKPLGKSDVELAPETGLMTYRQACNAARKLSTGENYDQGVYYGVYEVGEDGSYTLRR